MKAIDCDTGNPKSALPVVREKFEMAKDKRIARLVFAGDNHAFQFFWPTDPASPASPIQIIAGNGGTKLDILEPLLEPPGTKKKPDPNKKPGEEPDPDTTPPKVNEVTSWGRKGSNLTLMQHGFTVMQRVGDPMDGHTVRPRRQQHRSVRVFGSAVCDVAGLHEMRASRKAGVVRIANHALDVI